MTAAEGCLSCLTRRHCVFRRAAPATLALLAPGITARRATRGSVLATQGELPTRLRVLKVGSAFLLRSGLDGRSRPIGISGPGTAFGLFGLIGLPMPVTVVAQSGARVCELALDDLRRGIAADADLSAAIAAWTHGAVATLASWSESIRFKGLGNQVVYTLLLLAESQHGSVVEVPTHSLLADLLGTTRESVARAFATLRGDGSVKHLGRRRFLLDRQKLLARLAAG